MPISNGGMPKWPAAAAEPSTKRSALQTRRARPARMAREAISTLLAPRLMSEYLTAIAVAAQLHRTTYQPVAIQALLKLARATAAVTNRPPNTRFIWR